jgi:hypothetical protein
MVLGGALAAVLTPREIFLIAGGGTLIIPVLLARRLLRAVDTPATYSAAPSADETATPGALAA